MIVVGRNANDNELRVYRVKPQWKDETLSQATRAALGMRVPWLYAGILPGSFRECHVIPRCTRDWQQGIKIRTGRALTPAEMPRSTVPGNVSTKVEHLICS